MGRSRRSQLREREKTKITLCILQLQGKERVALRIARYDPPNRRLTCRGLAQSHSGDYHDNMNSEMFMKCVEEKIVPTFEQCIQEKSVSGLFIMHHTTTSAKGSLASLTMSQLIDMMAKHDVD
jgi:hypothetical protein